MMDLRWPWWPSGTYFANWNSGFQSEAEQHQLLCRIRRLRPRRPGLHPQSGREIQDSFRPGSVWTFWGSDKDGTPVRFTDVAPNLFIKNDYGGEGSSGTMGAEVWPFVQCKRWYTMLGRVWQPVGDGDPMRLSAVGSRTMPMENGISSAWRDCRFRRPRSPATADSSSR